MKIIHLSTECYPVAKVGGLGDVVGALPRYLTKQQVDASVVLPKYSNEWIQAHEFQTVFGGQAQVGEQGFSYQIQREKSDVLGFPLFVIDVPGLLDRKGIYMDEETSQGYDDDFERYLCFQIAALDWIQAAEKKPHVIHCHDHPVGLLPFMLTQCHKYRDIKHIPTAVTVHNGEYHGVYNRDKSRLLPSFDGKNIGLLDWDGNLNSLAAALKCSWAITTVSPSYMKELSCNSSGLEWLFQNEQQKSRGIINGIDTEVWNPATDPMISSTYSMQDVEEGKQTNKEVLCEQFGLNPQYPLIAYIGRLAREKGADLLPDVFQRYLESSKKVNFLVLGTGDRSLHHKFEVMRSCHIGFFDAALDYNEPLAHQIYAGSDFMMMPSRVEPCGLNQMYSMGYGTIPIVRNIGGLKDTVKDIQESDGYGITFDDFTLTAANGAVSRAITLFENTTQMAHLRKKIMGMDFSWNASVKEYIKLYRELSKE